jgi:hypothetical protein
MHLYYDILQPIHVAVSYFLGVYFVTVTLVPAGYAVIVASVVTALALLGLLQLRRAGMHTHGLPIFFLAVVFPFAILSCALIAWVVRYLVG